MERSLPTVAAGAIPIKIEIRNAAALRRLSTCSALGHNGRPFIRRLSIMSNPSTKRRRAEEFRATPGKIRADVLGSRKRKTKHKKENS